MYVGFLYTVVIRDLLGCGITKVSKKGMDQSAPVSPEVNWLYGSKLLMCSRHFSSMTTSVIHVPLP